MLLRLGSGIKLICSLVVPIQHKMCQYKRFRYFLHLPAAMALVSGQTHLSLHCLHTQSMDVNEGSDQKFRPEFTGYVSMGIH